MNLIISIPTQADFIINQVNGLYSLNDLHKVAGGSEKHKPSNFLRNAETQAMINELESENIIAYHTVQGGNTKTTKQGTYVCRELVYAYAMWISAEFSLLVIRAFDAMNTGAIPCLPPKAKPAELDPKRQQALKSLVHLIASNFKFKESATHAIWARLRTVTGKPSPTPFTIHDMPMLADELYRLIGISEQYANTVHNIEKHIFKTAFRHGGDVTPLLVEFHKRTAIFDEQKCQHLGIFRDSYLALTQ